MYGWDGEIDRLIQRVQSVPGRLVSITGPGGIGKRFAWLAASHLIDFTAKRVRVGFDGHLLAGCTARGAITPHGNPQGASGVLQAVAFPNHRRIA